VHLKAPGLPKGAARLRVVKLGVDGFERAEVLLTVGVTEGGEVLDEAAALELLRALPPEASEPRRSADEGRSPGAPSTATANTSDRSTAAASGRSPTVAASTSDRSTLAAEGSPAAESGGSTAALSTAALSAVAAGTSDRSTGAASGRSALPAPSAGVESGRSTEAPTAAMTERSPLNAALDDAVEQAVFFAQAGLDAAEHHRYESALLQGERFIEDRLLVLRKRRATLDERLELATLRRDGATGSEAREDAERSRTTLATQLEALDVELERLSSRDDPRFQTHQAHIQRRRYTPPRLETLFDLDLVIE
jgi:hypothetical protein